MDTAIHEDMGQSTRFTPEDQSGTRYFGIEKAWHPSGLSKHDINVIQIDSTNGVGYTKILGLLSNLSPNQVVDWQPDQSIDRVPSPGTAEFISRFRKALKQSVDSFSKSAMTYNVDSNLLTIPPLNNEFSEAQDSSNNEKRFRRLVFYSGHRQPEPQPSQVPEPEDDIHGAIQERRTQRVLDFASRRLKDSTFVALNNQISCLKDESEGAALSADSLLALTIFLYKNSTLKHPALSCLQNGNLCASWRDSERAKLSLNFKSPFSITWKYYSPISSSKIDTGEIKNIDVCEIPTQITRAIFIGGAN